MLSPPRFRDLPSLLSRSAVALDRWRGLDPESPVIPEVQGEWRASLNRLVFESNRIEAAGMPFAATRAALDEFFGPLQISPASPPPPGKASPSEGGHWLSDGAVRDALRVDDRRMDARAKALARLALPESLDEVVLRHGGQSRRLLEVRQHAEAVATWERKSAELQGPLILRALAKLCDAGPDGRGQIEENHGAIPAASPLGRILAGEALPPGLTAEELRFVHAQLMAAQPYPAGEAAGTWASTHREVGPPDRVRRFLAPENIDAAVQRLLTALDEELSNLWLAELARRNGLQSFLAGAPTPIELAASFSFRFVAIHPFADGNGRMSRLLLNLILRVAGVPFFAVLSGDSVGKRRYIAALERAHRGDLTAYHHLIATAVLAGWERVDERLPLLGLPPLLPPAEP